MIDTPQPGKSSAPTASRAVINLIVIIGTVILSTMLLQSLKQRGWTHYNLSKSGLLDQNGNVSITAIAVDSNGQVWVGTGEIERPNVIAMLEKDGTWKTYPLSESKIPDGVIRDLAVDKDNRVWVATDVGLEVLTPQGTWEKIVGRSGVSALATDPQGEIWAGSKYAISHFINNQWRNYTAESAEQSLHGFRSIFVDQQGQVWAVVGIYLDVLMPDGSWKNNVFPYIPVPVSSTVLGSNYQTLAIDNQNRVWLGAEDGLYFCQDSSGECVKYDRSNSGLVKDFSSRNSVYDIAFDSKNKLWISTYNGILILDADQALPTSLIPLLMSLKSILLFFLGYLYVARQLPQKNNALVGALGGGLASVIIWFTLDLTVLQDLAVIGLIIGLVIGLVVGFIGGKIGGEKVAYIGGGLVAGTAILLLAVIASAG